MPEEEPRRKQRHPCVSKADVRGERKGRDGGCASDAILRATRRMEKTERSKERERPYTEQMPGGGQRTHMKD